MQTVNSGDCVTLGLAPSFGFGDRIGLATPGHVLAMQRCGIGIEPIFPQQSIREMTRTGRSATQVMSDAMQGARNAGWTGKIGADADHLKTFADVDVTSAAGFTFFTIDPSEYVDQKADDYSESMIREKFESVRELTPWFDEYLGRTIEIRKGVTIGLDEQACMRAAVKYGTAIRKAIELSSYIDEVHVRLDRPYEIELSVDETDQPTTLAEHYIIAEQCLRGGMRLVSLAPRFIGELEKGVDYIGDLKALENSLENHAAIAQMLGPYKLSLHSGSDKLSMYEHLARATEGRFHVKTAGTSYLEALRVAARHDEPLFRRIIRFAREHYDRDRATYHVSATVAGIAPDETLSLSDAESVYLECWKDVPGGRGFTQPGRQILHCTFGSTLTDPVIGRELKAILQAYPETYAEILADHFGRHLRALQAGM